MKNKMRAQMIKRSVVTLFVFMMIVLLGFFIAKSSRLESEVYNLTQVNRELQNELGSLSKNVDEMSSVLQFYKVRVTELTDSITALEKEVAQLKEEERLNRSPYNLSDLRQPSNATADILNGKLKGSGLAGFGEAYITAEKNHGINAYYLTSLTIWESGWGRSKLTQEKFNVAGYGAENESFDKAYDFTVYKCTHDDTIEHTEDCVDREASIRHSIDYVASKLKDNYLTEGGAFFNGYGISDINIRYAVNNDGTPNLKWSKGIKALMRQLSSNN